MNIHEHQAKQILKKYGAVVPKGIFALNVDELVEKAKTLKTEEMGWQGRTQSLVVDLPPLAGLFYKFDK